MNKEEVIPLPNIKSAIFKKATYHKHDLPPLPEDGENHEKNTDISPWDQEFLKVDQGTLFDLILAATYLDIKGLLYVTCQTVANIVREKTLEEEEIKEKDEFCEEK